ncbi:amidohydrolase family protein [Kitasatospora sp. RB6PN24]|uniref:amidohydrolase family protein n=1 Tax=Kitasatospora humi TaxID=2893891 RepID=UPI001E450E1E|nr:amidohydrolase family protein [Kitasatospora humi]MCC9308623.1 amidohydrolase family protein [Kitasatospora humi]
MTTDVHAHVTVDVPAQLARARQAGVERTVLLPTSVHPEAAATNEELRAEFAGLMRRISGATLPEERFRAALDEVRRAVRAHPRETVGFASVPLELPELEIHRWVAEQLAHPEFVGLGELTPAPGGTAAVEPVLAAAADHGGVPVLVHGFAPNTLDDLRTYHLLAARYPAVPVIVGALGGMHALDLVELAADRPNLYLDLSSALQTFAVRAAARTVPEQCLFGSNTPYGDVVAARHTVESAVRDQAVLDLLLGGNFQRICEWAG